MASHEHYNARNDSYPPQQYTDQNDGAFNPYDNAQPHRTYEQGDYGFQEVRDEDPPILPSKEKENSPYVSSRTVPSRYVCDQWHFSLC